jgi:hypothetical protein
MSRMRAVAGSRRWVRPAVIVVGALVVFLFHFRPWEGGLLEEWAIADDWQRDGGWGVFAGYLQWTLSRPLHLFPTLIGLAVGGGAPSAIFGVIAVVAVGQYLAVIWAVRPLSRSFWVSTSVAFAIALHPLWPGGFLQRFLPAQVAMLALLLALGFAVRYLRSGRARWAIALGLTLLAGLGFYPGPAVVAPIAAAAVALTVQASLRRRIVVVATATAASAVMTLYSLAVVRLVSSDGAGSYELNNIEQAAVTSIGDLIRYIGFTIVGQGLLLIAGVLAVATLGALLALTGAIPDRIGWLIAACAVVSPMTAVVFFGSAAWLQDIDRLGYTTSMMLAVSLLLWPIAGGDRRPPLEHVLASVLVAVSLLGAWTGVRHWQQYVGIQHELFAALTPVVEATDGDEAVVVVDRSGNLGQLYTFPLQYLDPAARVATGDPTHVWLCFDEASSQPLPAGGTVCAPSDLEKLQLVTTAPIGSGEVDLYTGQWSPPDGQ